MYNIGGLTFLNEAAYKTLFMKAYEEATRNAQPLLDVYGELYVEEQGTDPIVYDSYLSALPQMRPMRASHPDFGGTEQGMTLVKIPYKAEVTLDRNQMEATRGQALFERTVDGLAFKAARFKANLIMDLVMANGTCHDGVTYFNASHVFERSGTQSNTATTAFAAGAGYATELPNFMQLADSAGEPIGTQPNVVLVSPTLYPAAMTYFNPNGIRFDEAGTAAGGMVVTPLVKVAPVLGTSNNTPSATEWYMFQAESPSAKPFAVYETEAPRIEVTSQDADLWKVHHKLNVVVSWYGIASYGPWFLAYRANT